MAQPHDSDQPSGHDWTRQAHARGLSGALCLALDVLEPLGPLAAQLLWMAQPAAALFGWRQAVGGLAHALEEPGGVERLRQRLLSHEDGPSGDHSSSGDNTPIA